MKKYVKNELDDAIKTMKEITDDRGVPRNIRAAVENALKKVECKKPKTVDFSMAIYLLDDISNDINMPLHTRTAIWNAISKLESVKEKIKELE
ncbi:MAG: UPF0147 family protein [Candidatus Diapherotrites archaeon]|nr:UPF0147 family protein [Candidatus Diapherotrites archaeon]